MALEQNVNKWPLAFLRGGIQKQEMMMESDDSDCHQSSSSLSPLLIYINYILYIIYIIYYKYIL
jgi:hypothetical protein